MAKKNNKNKKLNEPIKKNVSTKPAEQKAEETNVETVEKPKEVETETVESPKDKGAETVPTPPEEIVIEPTEVIENKPKEKKKSKSITSIAEGLNSIANGERIDINHSIDLSKMIYNHYVINPDSTPELKKSMESQFNAMTFIQLMHWNEQTKRDFKEAGVRVNEEMFNAMSEAVRNSLGLNLKAIEVDKNQLEIDFEATLEGADDKAKEIIEKEKKVDVKNEIPEYREDMTETEIMDALRSIMSMKNGMGGNLHNAIVFARKAFKNEKAKPAAIIAKMIEMLKPEHPLLCSFRGMAFGSLVKYENPFTTHALLAKQLLPLKYTESEIAEIVRLFIDYGIENNWNKSEAEDKNLSLVKDRIAYSKILQSFNDNLINKIIEAANDEKKKVEYPKVEGILHSETIDCKSVVNRVKETYGKDCTDKILKKVMQAILNQYIGKPITSIEELSKLV